MKLPPLRSALPVLLVLLVSALRVMSQQPPPSYPVPGQSEDFPLTTALGQDEMKELYDLVWNYTVRAEFEAELRKTLHPLADSGDALAAYLLAESHDRVMMATTDEDHRIALKYYSQAAEAGFAKADFFLYQAYRYNFMELPEDQAKSWMYLNRALLHGDSKMKADVYREMAHIYGDNEGLHPMDWIHPSVDSTIYFLLLALELEPDNGRTLDWLGGIYAAMERWDEAVELYMRSDNEQMKLKVAKWLLEGKEMPQDRKRGLEIIQSCAAQVRRISPPNGEGYMGVVNPIYLLNEMYYCDKSITEEELGEYDMGYWICEP